MIGSRVLPLSFAEEKARVKRAGLWKDPEPVAAWEWRHR